MTTLHRCVHPVEVTPRAQNKNAQWGENWPQKNHYIFEGSLELVNRSVYESTICKTLNRNGIHGRTSQRKHCSQSKSIVLRLNFTTSHLDTPPKRKCLMDRSWTCSSTNGVKTAASGPGPLVIGKLKHRGCWLMHLWLWSGPGSAQTSGQQSCCGMTSRVFHIRCPKNMTKLKLNKGSFWTVSVSDPQLQEAHAWTY